MGKLFGKKPVSAPKPNVPAQTVESGEGFMPKSPAGQPVVKPEIMSSESLHPAQTVESGEVLPAKTMASGPQTKGPAKGFTRGEKILGAATTIPLAAGAVMYGPGSGSSEPPAPQY
jgi:hypothetical protein